MKQRLLRLIVECLLLSIFSQDALTQNSGLASLSITKAPQQLYGDSGIKWTDNLSWQQILKKAKEENKYIFVDCYATWCGPCRQMDSQVFIKQEVGKFLEDNFIAVKVQMDSTKRDSESAKAWYKDASMLEKEYFVFAYPTQLFFNPNGELVEKTTGFQDENKFLNIAQSSLKPGKQFNDPYKDFLVLKDNYQRGERDYQKFPLMISIAKKSGQNEFAQNLLDELHKYLQGLSNRELLNRNYIEFINEYEFVSKKSLNDNVSRVFFRDGKKVDALMGIKNYSKNALNEMIRRGYVTKFLSGVTGRGSNANASIPWDSLYNDIARRFTKEIADQNILWAKIWYFDFYRDSRALIHFIEFTKRYGTEALFGDAGTTDYYINYMGWIYCVKRESDIVDTKYITELLKKAIENTIEREKEPKCHPYQFIDTYALLLDKIGEKDKAIKNQLDAIDIYLSCGGGTKGDKQHQEMLKQLGKLQNGEVNFSGRWILNRDKTQFNKTPGKPAATTLLVVQKADSITFQRNDHPKESLRIDSSGFIEISDANSKTRVSMKPTPNKQGLIETRIYNYPDGVADVVAVKKIRTWTLAADKKTLTIQDHIETTAKDQNFDMLLIYDRQ